MRLLRKLIFGIIGFVLLIVIALVLVFAISYDESKCSIDMTKDYRKIDTIVGDGIFDSLDNIRKSNYEESKNNISFGITQDELNYYLVQAIRNSVNPKYLDGDDYIIKDSNYSLQSFEFQIKEDVMEFKLRLNVYFYQTSVRLSAKLSLDNKLLRFKLEGAKLGYLPMPIDIIKSVMSSMDFKISESSGFDPKNFEFVFSMDDLLKSTENNAILATILNNCDYLITIADNQLKLSIDTNKVFKEATVVPEASDAGLTDILNEAEIEASSDPEYHYCCKISEANFNYLIMGNINSSTEGFKHTFKVGNRDLELKLGNMAYDIVKEAFVTNLYICGCSSPVEIGISINPQFEGGVVTKLGIQMGAIKIGDIENSQLQLFDFGDIDIDVLGFNDVKVNNIEFDKENRKIIVSGIYQHS